MDAQAAGHSRLALLSLPANGAKTVRLPKALRGRVIGSVKAYYSR
jgi:hypothetical protein